ncbi:MAG: hypothetical protein IT323_05470 [Anaerolineae bacterium]|nr:hypothetical protein [Anaerolineae bacterium]
MHMPQTLQTTPRGATFLKRRTRNGQSIVILAFAFIVLIAFVGIAVDVALLFVRYSALRRAVDSAAIAAAGQVREGTDYATLQAVAEQFVGLQGSIDTDSVRVETCETEIVEYIAAAAAGLPPAGTPTRTLNAQQALGEILGNTIRPSELCKRDPQKLVRVSAQVASPTTFLSLLGWGTVLLEASSVSQTAVLDVALVLDTSRSQAFFTQTDQENYAIGASGNNSDALRTFRLFLDPLKNSAGSYVLQPYPATQGDPAVNDWPNVDGLHDGQPAVRAECWYDASGLNNKRASNYGWGGCCNDPTTQTNPDGSSPQRVFVVGSVDLAGRITNPGRYGVDGNKNPTFTANDPPYLSGAVYDPAWYIYDAPGMSEAKIMTDGLNPRNVAAARIVNGMPDGNYADLVCRPFKDVRDAARRFLKRLDFVRGDRVVLVTFDAEAKWIYPASSSTVPVITDKLMAIRTLDQRIGISINPNGRQDGCLTQTNLEGVNPWGISSYWTVSQCPDTNMGGGIRAGRAALTNPQWIRRDSVWVMVLLSDGVANRTPSMGEIESEFNVAGPERNWLTVPSADQASSYTADQIRQYCSPTWEDFNDNGTLEAGEDMNGNGYLDWHPNYGLKPHLCVPPAWNEDPAWGLVQYDTSGGAIPQYSFGFCPWYTFCDQSGNTPLQPECTANDTQPAWWSTDDSTRQYSFQEPAEPRCVDWNPDTRHFCSDLEGIVNAPGAWCDPKYDPDDYARDQADFAGLIDYTKKMKGSFIAMFSIFFTPEPGNINENILGVKLLRYIADAGDNGVINNRLQAWYRLKHEEQLTSPNDPMAAPPLPPSGGTIPIEPADRAVYDVVGVSPNSDPCYPFDTTANSAMAYNSAYDPGATLYEAAAKQDCGQFWFANNLTKVDAAFTEIASRLFTRLSR